MFGELEDIANKRGLNFPTVHFVGIFCNFLVCLLAW